MIKNIGKILLILSLLLLPNLALAAEDGEMAIYPANWDGENELTKYWYIYNVDKGNTHHDQVVVENTGNTPLSIKIYPVDALTTADGAFALENEDENKDDVGAWVKLSESELDLAPNEQRVVDFTIDIPAETEPGEHIGGIIIENKTIKEGEQLNIKTRVGVRIYETVPGEVVKKASIDNIEVAGYYPSVWSLFYKYNLKYDLINEGNVQISPDTDVSVNSNWFGHVEASTNSLDNGSIFPGKKITPEKAIEKALWFGPYNLTITSQIEGVAPVQKVYTFWVLPWKLILLIAIVVVGLISWVYSSKKVSKNNSKIKKEVKNNKKTVKRKAANRKVKKNKK
ncbi:MAG: DUF916 domain-containing protein [Patescibacteria group bacterium]